MIDYIQNLAYEANKSFFTKKNNIKPICLFGIFFY